MTYLEYRARLAALTTAHRAAVAALHAEYGSQDREAIKAQRKAARDAAHDAQLLAELNRMRVAQGAKPLASLSDN